MGNGLEGRAFMARVLAATLAGKSKDEIVDDEFERMQGGRTVNTNGRPWLTGRYR